MDEAYVDGEAELASSEPQCRGRTGVLVIANASGQDILRILLIALDDDSNTPALELPVKERGRLPTRYEILFQDCGPRRTKLRIDQANGDFREADLSLHPGSITHLVMTPSGIR
jgi:hypothetical protein